ncbi:hypothetical protein BCV53_19310 (plasmid) [Parageobacillus thermoglucosidasius]|uniref:Uncharacterized protein n=1 Tax=Parageobacillus thermoglucosidasius TaxID=1426 RepID=A0AAN1D8I9_PARTM|nr:hypothetical protein BCV53_19310 [Parageobacillus thermoglucosidasius]APM82983.1 hypothetical protein BCV54_19330 [Parageobacillus thermoglucosidasius]KJX67452.1 hypothetical protein WH82_17845 [Parageobacillus thermoglucosidasius]
MCCGPNQRIPYLFSFVLAKCFTQNFIHHHGVPFEIKNTKIQREIMKKVKKVDALLKRGIIFLLPFINENQSLSFGANPLIQLFVIRHLLYPADFFLSCFRLFPVQRVILDQRDHLFFLTVRVVLLTPIGGQLLQMRNETSGLPRPLMHAKSSDELVLCPYLHIVPWFELAVFARVTRGFFLT